MNTKARVLFDKVGKPRKPKRPSFMHVHDSILFQVVDYVCRAEFDVGDVDALELHIIDQLIEPHINVPLGTYIYSR